MKKLMLCAAALFVSVSGCGAIDAAVDCHAICSRYQTCFDASYDESGCETRCRSHSSDDTDYRHAAAECSDCITDKACASATFTCGTQCGTVVP